MVRAPGPGSGTACPIFIFFMFGGVPGIQVRRDEGAAEARGSDTLLHRFAGTFGDTAGCAAARSAPPCLYAPSLFGEDESLFGEDESLGAIHVLADGGGGHHCSPR